MSDCIKKSYLSSDTNDLNKTSEDHVKDILEKDLPRSERQSLQTELKWNYILDKHKVGEKKSKFIRRKKLFLTRSQRKDLNLLKLPKDGWNYNDLRSMRNMWIEYMRKNLSLIKKTPSCEEPSWCNLSSILTKSEFIGAEITVVRSTVPSTVGITGTVVLETKSTFQIVTPNSELKSKTYNYLLI